MSIRMIFLLILAIPLSVTAQEDKPASKRPSNKSPSSKIPSFSKEVLSDAKNAAIAANCLESIYAETTPPEGVRMLIAILKGSQMGPGDGWFGPAEARYNWKWLAGKYARKSKNGLIPVKPLVKAHPLLAHLDRDHDGQITPMDLDWSPNNPYIQQTYMVNRLFRKMDTQGDGKLTQQELLKFFEKATNGKDHLTSESLTDALLSRTTQPSGSSDFPTRGVLVRGLFAGEIGSMNEGPKVNQPAPNFALKTVDGKQTIELSKLTGSKPVVLVFGNFTCGPFRSFYPGVEAVYDRYKKDAHFVMIYVREAHPTDGWHMSSNDHVGVKVKQPITFGERVKVANQFCQRLNTTMPVVVDELNDPVGHAYSGMPARLYVIDPQGKVAYKSGRGPFGFKAGEMEQALLMTLLDNSSSTKNSGEYQ